MPEALGCVIKTQVTIYFNFYLLPGAGKRSNRKSDCSCHALSDLSRPPWLDDANAKRKIHGVRSSCRIPKIRVHENKVEPFGFESNDRAKAKVPDRYMYGCRHSGIASKAAVARWGDGPEWRTIWLLNSKQMVVFKASIASALVTSSASLSAAKMLPRPLLR